MTDIFSENNKINLKQGKSQINILFIIIMLGKVYEESAASMKQKKTQVISYFFSEPGFECGHPIWL